MTSPSLSSDQQAPTAAERSQQAGNSLTEEMLPSGFLFASTACGIKPSQKLDLSVVAAAESLTAAGVYTQNKIVAAPVVLCRQITPSNNVRAVVTCSGNANACTGEQGMENAKRMASETADLVGCRPDQVLVMSTGIIGQQLPIEKIEAGIRSFQNEFATTKTGFLKVAEAIRTTDQFTKVAHRQIPVDEGTIRVVAMAKGAGMIEPNMATLLAMVFTDACLSPDLAQSVLRNAADQSLNRISVDGHTSTNDTLLLLTNGKGVVPSDQDVDLLTNAISDALMDLGRMIVADGEGASHYMELTVEGAMCDDDATTVAKEVVNSPLVKTAITGGDPNWGRIISAVGNTDIDFDPDQLRLEVLGVPLYANGSPQPLDASKLSQQMKANECIPILIRIGSGKGRATFIGSDLTCQYVTFNSEYTT